MTRNYDENFIELYLRGNKKFHRNRYARITVLARTLLALEQ